MKFWGSEVSERKGTELYPILETLLWLGRQDDLSTQGSLVYQCLYI